MDVAVLASNCRRYRREIPLCSFYRRQIEVRRFVRRNGSRPSDGFLDWWKVLRSICHVDVPILDRHEMWQGALVIEEPWQPGVLRYRRRCRIRLQLSGELPLQPLNQVDVEPGDAPEHVDMIWRRVQDVARDWQVSPRLQSGQKPKAIVVRVEKNVTNRADCVTGPGAAAQGDRVDADEDVVPPSVHRP